MSALQYSIQIPPFTAVTFSIFPLYILIILDKDCASCIILYLNASSISRLYNYWLHHQNRNWLGRQQQMPNLKTAKSSQWAASCALLPSCFFFVFLVSHFFHAFQCGVRAHSDGKLHKLRFFTVWCCIRIHRQEYNYWLLSSHGFQTLRCEASVCSPVIIMLNCMKDATNTHEYRSNINIIFFISIHSVST